MGKKGIIKESTPGVYNGGHLKIPTELQLQTLYNEYYSDHIEILGGARDPPASVTAQRDIYLYVDLGLVAMEMIGVCGVVFVLIFCLVLYFIFQRNGALRLYESNETQRGSKN